MELPNVPPPPPPPAATASPVTIAKSSSGFPVKVILLLVLALIIVGGGAFLVKQFASSKKSGPVTLTYWGMWESDQVMKPLIDAYQTAHPEIHIDYKFQSAREYRERLQNALSSGSGPDIFKIHSSWVPMFKQDLAPVPPQAYSASQFESTFYPTAKADLRLGNNYVAVPLEYDGLGMFVNEDLLAKGGKTVPQNWVDLRQTAIDLSVCDSADGKCTPGSRVLVSGAAMGTADNVDHWQDIVAVLMMQNNVNLANPVGQTAQDVLEYYTIFNRSDHIWDSTLPNSTTAFANNKVAIMFAPSWRVFDILAANPNLKFNVYPVPQAPLDPARGEKPVAYASYWAEAVNKKSPNAAAAWDFVKYLSSQDSLQKLYKSAVDSGRVFGEPYSRVDMAADLANSKYVAAYISQAPMARSWYLVSSTYDGASGLNSRLSTYFADAINGVNQGKSLAEAVTTLSAGVNQVLSAYGLATPIAPAQ